MVNIENLTPWLPSWFPLSVFLVRFYQPGVQPVEPNEFESTVVVSKFGPVGIVKGAVKSNNKMITHGSAAIKHHGVSILVWRHNLKWNASQV